MTRSEKDRHLTALDLDVLEWGEPPVAAGPEVVTHLARCAACAARRSEHGALIGHFRGGVFARGAIAVAARARARPNRLWSLWLALPAAIVALLVIVHGSGGRKVGVGNRPTTDTTIGTAFDTTIGVKGGGLFEVFARHARRDQKVGQPAVERVASGMRLAPGDALRFVLYPAGLSYALIASVDGAGQVSIYFPFRGTASAPIDGRSAQSLPGSIVLDRAAGPERLFAILSERPIEARLVREALARTAAGGSSAIRAAAHLPLPGTVQATLLFEKEPAQ
jgi:hypothetical protein